MSTKLKSLNLELISKLLTTIFFVLFLGYLPSYMCNAMIDMLGLPVEVSFNVYRISAESDVLPAYLMQSQLILIGFVVFCILVIYFFMRGSATFVFLCSNGILLSVCLLLDFIAYGRFDAWGEIASGSFNFFLYAIFFSLAFFAIFLHLNKADLLRLFLCTTFSLFWLFFSVVILSVLSTGFSGATLTFMFYAVLAYGTFGLHIWSLSWLLLNARFGPPAAPR